MKKSLASLGWWMFFIILTVYGVWDKALDAGLPYISAHAWYSPFEHVFVPVYHAIVSLWYAILTFKSCRAIYSRAAVDTGDRI